MLRLTTLGGLRLARGRESLTGAATQRRRLAILALLAAAGERGLSRDKLVGYLWPESQEERARHVLNQLLYAQRQSFGDDDLFLGKKTLRLNPAVIWTDVGAFEAALDTQALEEAVGYYEGPFLDGFFLSDSPTFDQWVETQRERLGRRLRASLSARAASLAGQGDAAGATAWWRRVADLDPLDSQVARRLVETLAGSGDVPGAVRYARRHRDLLRTELDLPLDPAFHDLVERMARGEPWS